MQNNKQKTLLNSRRAISPILATVVLLGITVVAGGLVFSVFSSSTTAASSADVIAIQNAQAIKGSDHSDLTVTVKNAGSSPWAKIEMTVSKSSLSEPILYESLHEVVHGCTGVVSTCVDGEDTAAAARENPLRADWLASLDKTSGTDNQVDFGEGIAAGRKLVFDDKDDQRTIQILNATHVSKLFGDTNGLAANSAMTTCAPSTDTDCSTVFKQLNSSVKGNVYCTIATAEQAKAGIYATCKIFTHQNIKDSPIGAGQSIYFYADAFTTEVPGLNNQVVRVGDNIVANIFATNADGGEARVQTIIKVSGV